MTANQQIKKNLLVLGKSSKQDWPRARAICLLSGLSATLLLKEPQLCTPSLGNPGPDIIPPEADYSLASWVPGGTGFGARALGLPWKARGSRVGRDWDCRLCFHLLSVLCIGTLCKTLYEKVLDVLKAIFKCLKTIALVFSCKGAVPLWL